MQVEDFLNIIKCDFYTGVPDSQLKPLCDFLMGRYGIDSKHHVIAANEGNCVALAAGYHLATGKVPAIYLQNSGEGNILNPVVSLLHKKVYGIPAIFIIGFRGEPEVHDEPQHLYQGEITLKLLEDMGINCFVIEKETTIEALIYKMKEFREILSESGNVAFVIKRNSLFNDENREYVNNHFLVRENVIEQIVKAAEEDIIVSTTGKTSRELFEIRARNKQSHKRDFLTVGSMGHSSSIALGVAIHKPNKRVWCIDGDGAVLMHMGAMALIGSIKPENMVHVLINNGSHETVGGMPTVAENIDLTSIAKACGYPHTVSIDSYERLEEELSRAKKRNSLSLIEVKCKIESRKDLGRPTITTMENKKIFMEYLDNPSLSP